MSEAVFTSNSRRRIVLATISACLALLMSLSWVASAQGQTSAEDVYDDPAASGEEAITSAGISSASASAAASSSSGGEASASASASASAAADPSSSGGGGVLAGVLPSTGGPAILPGVAIVSLALLVTGGLIATRNVTARR